MTRAQIEARIEVIQDMLCRETNARTLATLNRCLERLIMMDADDDDRQEPLRSDGNGTD